jgi:hypothetical protein
VTEDRNLTGLWHGTFSYPRLMAPTDFLLDLRDHNGSISGETHERSDQGPDRGRTISALVDGSRAGSEVRFTKRYDALHRRTPIAYAGTLNDEATEIVGTWTIPGTWSGTFIMVRDQQRKADVAERIAEKAPVAVDR